MAISLGEQKRLDYITKPTKLIKLRHKKKSSQVEIATALEMSRIHYGNIEKGIWTPKIDLVEKIAKHFKVPVVEIFKKIDDIHYVVKK